MSVPDEPSAAACGADECGSNQRARTERAHGRPHRRRSTSAELACIARSGGERCREQHDSNGGTQGRFRRGSPDRSHRARPRGCATEGCNGTRRAPGARRRACSRRGEEVRDRPDARPGLIAPDRAQQGRSDGTDADARRLAAARERARRQQQRRPVTRSRGSPLRARSKQRRLAPRLCAPAGGPRPRRSRGRGRPLAASAHARRNSSRHALRHGRAPRRRTLLRSAHCARRTGDLARPRRGGRDIRVRKSEQRFDESERFA